MSHRAASASSPNVRFSARIALPYSLWSATCPFPALLMLYNMGYTRSEGLMCERTPRKATGGPMRVAIRLVRAQCTCVGLDDRGRCSNVAKELLWSKVFMRPGVSLGLPKKGKMEYLACLRGLLVVGMHLGIGPAGRLWGSCRDA